ncbi:MAG: glucose-6-phosphate isomerase [Deltaproteobacteria bacterium]|nr:glucose-6-phosphate isomerase [Deltaproteobacteria bacterium]
MRSINLNGLEIHAGAGTSRVTERLGQWHAENVAARIWRGDGSVWVKDPLLAQDTPELSNRLGWLDLPATMVESLVEIEGFVAEVKAVGFTRAVVLGMGGSSLIAEVWAGVFGAAQGFLPVTILDSTYPLAVAGIAASGDLATTLFLVSSKSGGTLETLSFFNFFYDKLSRLKENPGENFVALTDPGSKLEVLARERGFRKIFPTPAEVGGRYSALTPFGLLPAALLGLPLKTLLQRAQLMMAACAVGIKVADNPALRLGAFMGELARSGRDKLTLVLSSKLQPFAVWLEQLIAESTGKKGNGLVPVIVAGYDDLPFSGRDDKPANDRLYLFLRLADDDNTAFDQAWSRVRTTSEPAALITLAERVDLAQEIWRFEMATAAAGAVLEINPFDQPDVEAAKIGARQAMLAWQESGSLPVLARLVDEVDLKVSGSQQFVGIADLNDALERFMSAAVFGDYIALLVYLPQSHELASSLELLQQQLQQRCRVPVTIGYGPRFLHSTGQLHKGDGNHGLFLQISGGAAADDLPLPGSGYSFATLIAAQAQGDYQALLQAGRRILAITLSDLKYDAICRFLQEMSDNL